MILKFEIISFESDKMEMESGARFLAFSIYAISSDIYGHKRGQISDGKVFCLLLLKNTHRMKFKEGPH